MYKIFAASMFVFLQGAHSQTSSRQVCSNVSQILQPEARASYQSLIAAHIQEHPTARAVSVEHYMQSGRWSAVFAGAAGAERGVFFFQVRHGRTAFEGVWGGVPSGDSKEDIAAWTKTLDPHFPRALALCFAQAVEAGQ